MRKIILIGGALASGKSTFANKLQKELGYTFLSKDKLKELCGDVFFCGTREENKKLSVLSFEFEKYIINNSNDNLIIESNFKDYEMVELEKLLKDYKVLSLKFSGDMKMLQERFLNRLNGDRHYVHRSEDFSDLNDFCRMNQGLLDVKYPGKVIDVCVSTDDTYSRVDLMKEIFDYLKD